MALETYRKKRDFGTTAEPKGGRARKKGNSFVIQKHDATRLHYDLRLEMDGVLKSWAVTKGPSLVPGEKRLAVHVEDHPLEYGDFEGTIPKGEYGGGTVIVWDRGTWTPVHDPAKGYAKGHMEFELKGEKLGGRWHLVRMQGKPREKRENWLLIKSEDEAARGRRRPGHTGGAAALGEDGPRHSGGRAGRAGLVVEDRQDRPQGKRPDQQPGPKAKPVAQGRPTSPAANAGGHDSRTCGAGPVVDPSQIKGAKKAALPDFVEPTLATLMAKPPAGGDGSTRSSSTATGCRRASRLDASSS